MLLKRGSALTSAHSAEPMGKAISSASLPNSMSFHAYALGQKVPTAEQARNADQCEDAEFDLVPIGMTRDARIAQAERRLGRFSVLKHDSFIGEAAVTGDALQGVSDDAMT